jgi:hypothetical protein
MKTHTTNTYSLTSWLLGVLVVFNLFFQSACAGDLNTSHWFYDTHFYKYAEPSAGVTDTSRLPALTWGYRNNQGLKAIDTDRQVTGNYEVALIPTKYTGSGTSNSYYTKVLGEIYMPIRNTTYIGLGYRNHYDHSGYGTTSTGYAGYDRQSQYFYLPFGAYYANSSGVFKTQYNFFIRGKQTSYFSQISGYKNNIQNTQTSGYGLDFSYIPNSANWELYWRYWSIGDSNTDAAYYTNGSLKGYYYEPANKTNEVGVRFAF